jgi:hypothetical protein
MNDCMFGVRIRLQDEPETALDDVALWLAETPIMTPFKGASASNETRKAFGLGVGRRDDSSLATTIQ